MRLTALVSKPLVSPYPPDIADDQAPIVVFGDLVDAVVIDVDWAGERAPGFSARRAELRRCRLTGAELAEATIADVTFVECRIDRPAFVTRRSSASFSVTAA